MSKATTIVGNKSLITNYDLAKIFLWAPKYENADLTNTTGGDFTFLAGTLLGRVAATQVLLPCVATAIDGSQFPVGVLAADVLILDTETEDVPFCIGGSVAEEKIIFDGVEDFDTIVDGRSYRDRIASDTMGIKLVTTTELTDFDNA